MRKFPAILRIFEQKQAAQIVLPLFSQIAHEIARNCTQKPDFPRYFYELRPAFLSPSHENIFSHFFLLQAEIFGDILETTKEIPPRFTIRGRLSRPYCTQAIWWNFIFFLAFT